MKILQLFIFCLFCCVTCVAMASDLRKSDFSIEPFHPPEVGFWTEMCDYFIPHFERKNIIYSKESEFFHITVQDTERHFRKLVFLPDHGAQSKIDLKKPNDVILNFMKYSFIGPALLKKAPERVLFIGLGAGTMPKFLRKIYPNSIIDIVEVDRGVLPVAEKYFGFHLDKKMKVITMDGRLFVNNNQKGDYDLIFIDAYNAEAIPFQITTLEFFQNIRRNLAESGIVIANIANFGNSDYTNSQFKTINQEFPFISVFACPYKTNFVLFASPKNYFSKHIIKSKLKNFDNSFECSFKLEPFFENLISSDVLRKNIKDSPIITDELAPFGD